MRADWTPRLCVAAIASVVLLGAGCGGDDEPAGGPVTPELTPPQASTDSTTATPPKIKTVDDGTDIPEDPSTETDTTEETTTEPPPTTKPRRVPDNPNNDTPPPNGSPEERFEQFCNSNPKACGG